MRSRLSQASLQRVALGTAVPAYDRARLEGGIAHIGPGAFARAHLASYVERLLAVGDKRWGMIGIALRHGAAGEALARQDFLYTLAELEAEPRYRVMGALKDFIVAPADPPRARLALVKARLITITVTEKGYCLGADGKLDMRHPDIVHDLAGPQVPSSLYGWLADGLARRPAPIVLSCDNLADNGPKLRAATIAFARARGHDRLADWIAEQARFPATMVDSITPASDAALLARVADATGLEDQAPVQREGFTQWVIEEVPGLPDLARAGAQITGDVHAYEQAKLRLLNGAHSALAYLGLLRGRATVFEAMADAPLGAFVERMMREDVAATLKPVFDVPAYIAALLARLRNPAIAHKLIQIAADGSLKLPYRFLEPVADQLAARRPIARLCVPVAAWMRFVVEKREMLSDPMADRLRAVAADCDGTAGDVARFLALGAIFPRALAAEPKFVEAVTTAYADLSAALAP
ncbi:MAG TPA: mannitol dehydrogenase family protein [Rhizomicrobium sp.]|jgi:fructuronate reductase|nr:mannitol dehydrogenase family protein [Rhizomicrobium sp.]